MNIEKRYAALLSEDAPAEQPTFPMRSGSGIAPMVGMVISFARWSEGEQADPRDPQRRISHADLSSRRFAEKWMLGCYDILSMPAQQPAPVDWYLDAPVAPKVEPPAKVNVAPWKCGQPSCETPTAPRSTCQGAKGTDCVVCADIFDRGMTDYRDRYPARRQRGEPLAVPMLPGDAAAAARAGHVDWRRDASYVPMWLEGWDD